jgi:Ni,Fe-hydrogenase III large subunit
MLAPEKCVHAGGDVAARASVRFDELQVSARLSMRTLEGGLPAGPVCAIVSAQTAAGLGIGLIEGWRGPVMVALEANGQSGIARCHPHDPSWQNWPVLEHAILGNIVPDFPLINKSFNLSYSGHDL